MNKPLSPRVGVYGVARKGEAVLLVIQQSGLICSVSPIVWGSVKK